jgi:hypothetical protein
MTAEAQRAQRKATVNQRLPGSMKLNRPLQGRQQAPVTDLPQANQRQRLPGSMKLNRPPQSQRRAPGKDFVQVVLISPR